MPALTRDIADRIASIKQDPDAWVPSDTPARFSLAGTQGKFALASLDGDWYWPNATVPSTHILKPARCDLPGLESAESAALRLARDVGIPAAAADVLHLSGQSVFVVERFDRVLEAASVLAQRLHVEDLAQALGIGPESKYDVTAKQVIAKLATVDQDGSLGEAFLAQFAFNTMIGNADAHAKNYSVRLRPGGISLAPLYDAVPVGLYPQFDQGLAMRVAGAPAVTIDHWRKFARTTGFDDDHVEQVVRSIAARIAEANDDAWSDLDDAQAARLRELVARNIEKLTA